MNKHTQKRESGSAIITVLVIVMIVVAAGGSMISMASQQAHSARLVRDEIKAQALAEAGANEAYAILKADFSAREDEGNFPEKEFAEGKYDAEVTSIGSDMAQIKVVAQVGDAISICKLDVKDFGVPTGGGSGAPPPGPDPAYQCALLAGSITWGGNGQTITGGGLVHAQTEYSMNGTVDIFTDKLTAGTQIRSVGNCMINGDAVAPVYKNASPGNVSGSAVTAAVTPIGIPTLDLAPYYQYCLDNGEVYNGDPGSYSPKGGIMWINGSAQIAGGAAIEGLLICTDDIKVTGNSTHTEADGFKGFISRDGDIEFNSQSVLYGLIFAPNGDIKMAGGGKVIGTVICAGEFVKQGGWDAIAWADSTPPDDPAGGASSWNEDDCQVCITCWHM